MSRRTVSGRLLCELALATMLGLATVGTEDASAQDRHPTYGVLVTSAFASRNPVPFPGPNFGDPLTELRPGSVEIEALYPLVVRPRFRLDYSVAALPLVWVRRSLVGVLPFSAERRTSYGFGLRPIGLRVAMGSERAALEVAVTGAVLRYAHPTPAADAARRNYSGAASIGLRGRLFGTPISVGFRQQHISNADRAPFNPGIDSSEFFLSVRSR